MRDHRHGAHRHQHESDRQQPDRLGVGAEILRGRAKRRRIHQRRQEHEQHHVGVNPRSRRPRHQPDHQTPEHQHDRVMDVDRAGYARQHGGGKQQSDYQLDRLHVRRRSPTWDAMRAVIDRSPVDSWHANAAPTRLPGSPPRMLMPRPSARYRSAGKRAAVTEELLASATGTLTVTPTSFLTDGTSDSSRWRVARSAGGTRAVVGLSLLAVSVQGVGRATCRRSRWSDGATAASNQSAT